VIGSIHGSHFICYVVCSCCMLLRTSYSQAVSVFMVRIGSHFVHTFKVCERMYRNVKAFTMLAISFHTTIHCSITRNCLISSVVYKIGLCYLVAVVHRRRTDCQIHCKYYPTSVTDKVSYNLKFMKQETVLIKIFLFLTAQILAEVYILVHKCTKKFTWMQTLSITSPKVCLIYFFCNPILFASSIQQIV
jgi:hypothetical protein